MNDAEKPPASRPRGSRVRTPADTNPYGDIFGGWLMSQMDLAAGTAAARHVHGRVVTVAVDGMTFHRPVKVGDIVSVYADVIGIGRSSLKIDVAAWRRTRASEDVRVTQATFTFVALGDDGRPRAIEA